MGAEHAVGVGEQGAGGNAVGTELRKDITAAA